MFSSYSSSKSKKHLTKDQNSCLILVIGVCSVFGALFLYFGCQELYKLQTLIIRHCQVKSVGLKYERNSFFPRWNISIIYENETINDLMIESIGTRSERWAWIKARKYKINETYLCYRSQNITSVIQWNWQWNKPTELKVYAFLCFGIILFITAVILLIIKGHYYIKSKKISQQSLISVENLPLTNEKILQKSILKETNI